MFCEHYSVADLFTKSIQKTKSKYSSSYRFICFIIAVPFTIKAVKNKNISKDTTSYSTYISYKITPRKIQQNDFESSNWWV